MKKRIIFLSVLFSIGACTPRIYVPAHGNIYSSTINEATYDDFNFSNSLFNQYSSWISYRLEITTYTTLGTGTAPIRYYTSPTVFTTLTGFTLISSGPPLVYAIDLNSTWQNNFNTVLFGRNFDVTTKIAQRYPSIRFTKPVISGTSDIFVRLVIQSRLNYKINVGSMLLGMTTNMVYGDPEPEAAQLITFYDGSNNNLGSFITFNLENEEPAVNTPVMYRAVFPLLFNNVSRFDITTSIIGANNTSDNFIELSEFNLFTDNEALAIPDNAGANLFGLEFIAVPWYDILGHFNNFLWWLVNDSFISPLFIWINTYIFSFITGLFGLIGRLLSL